jgi:multicopper oxidase
MQPVSRRQFLAVAAATATVGLAGGCSLIPTRSRPVRASSPAVAAAEARRRRPGAPVHQFTLTAAPVGLDLAGRQVTAWAYNHSVPGPLLRVRAGEVLRVQLDNRLPEATTIHWHGIRLRNDMDGVPDMTQPPIPPSSGFTYEFTAPDLGTYFFHPHVRLQLDRGLYAALLVDDPAEPGRYDHEAVVVLDDWTLGVGPTPEQLQDRLLRQGGMMGMDGGMGMMGQGGSGELGGAGGMIDYPLYLLNGHPPTDPPTFRARPGQRLRLRVVNAAADTAFRVALGGHRLTVTHTDGFPVAPVTADALLVGMGERCDALVTLGEGAFPLVALAEGKSGQAVGIVRTAHGTPAATDAHPSELAGRLAAMATLGPDPRRILPTARPDRSHQLLLSGGMMGPQWTINGRTFDQAEPLPVRTGERVRLVFGNQSMMFHLRDTETIDPSITQPVRTRGSARPGRRAGERPSGRVARVADRSTRLVPQGRVHGGVACGCSA